jgi:CRISPR/Cas system-associated endoribonuclease Cas2
MDYPRIHPKTSKSLKALKNEMFWLQVSLFLSDDRLLSVIIGYYPLLSYSPQKLQNHSTHSTHSKKRCFGSRCHFFYRTTVYYPLLSVIIPDDPLLSLIIMFTSKTSKSLKSLKNEMFWLQVSFFYRVTVYYPLLSLIIIFTSKTSKSLKSFKLLKNEMFWLQVSLFLSDDRLLSVIRHREGTSVS